MLPIHVSAWIALAIVLYGVSLFLAIGGAQETIKEFEGSTKQRRALALGGFLVVFAVCGGVINGFSYGVSLAPPSTQWASYAEVSEQFGLRSGHPYPLVLGERFGGARGHATARVGFFTARASVSMQPASAISVSFTEGDRSYILELPVAKTTFIQTTNQAPSVTLHLTSDSTYVDKEAKTGPCTTIIESGFLACSHSIDYSVVMDPATQRRGLSPVVADGLDSATMVLTPEMYRQVLGQNG